MLCLIGQEDFDTYLESTLLAERRIGFKYAQRGGEERLQGIIMCDIYTNTYFFKKHNIACYSFLSSCVLCSVSQLSSCRQAIARNGMGGRGLLPNMEIDDREEGRLSTVEVPVGDTGKRARVWSVEAWH